MEYNINRFQTKLTDDLKDSLPKEVWSQLIDYIESVPFIRHLISDESVRGTIKDRPFMKDSNGTILNRKEVDITKPHILENMDFFRERAIFFKKHGVYTHITPNPNPKSDYAKFWKEELRRWKKGLTRPDGEWIPGSLYFYWNYIQIPISEEIEGTKARSERKRDFPRVYLGDYLFFHYIEQARDEGQHGKMLKARGIGASLKLSSLTPCYMYTYPGSQNPNFHLASDKTFLTGDKGIWGKILDNLDWIGNYTPLPRMRIVDKKSSFEIQLGYEDAYGRRQGLLSSAYGVSLKDNPDKARGIRTTGIIHYEEDGLFPHLEKAWNVNREGTEEDGRAFGFMFAAGTGGIEGGSFEGSEKLFYSPGSYNIYGLPNVFDKNINGETKVGFFWGAYLNKGKSVTGENGEPDVIGSLVKILKNRDHIAKHSRDALSVTQAKAENPVTPQEAIMRTEGTIFPVSDLKDYLGEIKPNIREFRSSHYIGRLSLTSTGGVEWKPDADIRPLVSYNETATSKIGGVEIFVPPTNNSWDYRYISGIDPFDDDSGTSLGSILIFDTFINNIVAEYTGRPEFANDFFEICRRMLVYYNAIALYENKNKGLYNYFYHQNALHLLADNPKILEDMDMSAKKDNYGNKKKGFNPTKEINAWGRRLQSDWMKEIYEEHEDGEVIKNLQRIRSIPYVEETIAWNSDGNFDRVSAMNGVMILREELRRFIEEGEHGEKLNSVMGDPGWKKLMGSANIY